MLVGEHAGKKVGGGDLAPWPPPSSLPQRPRPHPLPPHAQVCDAKPLVRAAMIAAGTAAPYWEPERLVIARSGDECVVAEVSGGPPASPHRPA